jgi:hypothetical protein
MSPATGIPNKAAVQSETGREPAADHSFSVGERSLRYLAAQPFAVSQSNWWVGNRQLVASHHFYDLSLMATCLQ